MVGYRKPGIWAWLRGICIILEILSVIIMQPSVKPYEIPWAISIYVFLFLTLIVNELCRFKYALKSKNYFTVSLLVSIAISVVFYCMNSDYFITITVILFYLMLLYDILVVLDEKDTTRMKVLFSAHAAIYSAYLVYSAYSGIKSMYLQYFYPARNLSLLFMFKNSPLFKILISALYFIFFYLVFVMIFNQIRQKCKIERLYKELIDANKMLVEYSNKAGEFAVIEERNRMAQDIHDTIGHSLTALIMHLDYLEQGFDKDFANTKELVSKCQSFARDTLANVRKAVYALKDNKNRMNFSTLIKEMIDSITCMGSIETSFTYDEAIEAIPPELKHVLYRTIQEALTNSIRHANASRIEVSLNIAGRKLNLTISDNGIGTGEIIKNNGLNGIEKRIHSLGGSVDFQSSVNNGFQVSASIALN